MHHSIIEALSDFYISSGGGVSWNLHQNASDKWNFQAPIVNPCQIDATWQGIKCVGDGTVQAPYSITELDLSGQVLQGTLSSSIGMLTGLQSLVLTSSPMLGGSLPPSISKLQSLTHLDLSHNGFSSTLPSSFGEALVSMQTLFLSGNHFRGPLPDVTSAAIHGALYLGQIWLDSNHFTAENLPTYCYVTPQILVLESNDIGGTLPDCLRTLVLALSLNHLTGTLSTSFCAQPYVYFWIAGNSLSGTLPHCFGEMPNLKYLELQLNSFSSSLPSSMAQLNGLSELDVSNNWFTSMPGDYSASNLNSVVLNNNHFRGTVPTSICTMAQLGSLDLESNAFSHFPSCLANLKRLTVLNAGFNNFTHQPLPSVLFQLGSLEALLLSESGFSGTIPEALGTSLTNLVSLFLNLPAVHGTLPSSLFTLKSLEFLVIIGACACMFVCVRAFVCVCVSMFVCACVCACVCVCSTKLPSFFIDQGPSKHTHKHIKHTMQYTLIWQKERPSLEPCQQKWAV